MQNASCAERRRKLTLDIDNFEVDNFTELWTLLMKCEIISPEELDIKLKTSKKDEVLKDIAEILETQPSQRKILFSRRLEEAKLPYSRLLVDERDSSPMGALGNNVLNINAFSIQPGFEVKVKKATSYRAPSEDVYQMGSNPKGHAIIINNRHFYDSDRRGSERDFENLTKLFKGLDYKLYLYKDLTAVDMDKQLRNFSQMDHSCVDSIVIYIGTHGSENVLFGVDYDTIFLENIYNHFNNVNCPSSLQKPKLFIIQACRGENFDIGVIIPEKGDFETDSMPCSSLPRLIPTWTDMAIIHSSIPGYVSNRSVLGGSWLVQSLCRIFMENACDYHLLDLLRMVSKEIIDFNTSEGEKQSSEILLKGWRKNLYFNPGLFANTDNNVNKTN